jgi:hypothetical protein
VTVAEMIQQLQDLCDGMDPATVEIRKEVVSDDMWGADYEYFSLDSIGGNDYPLMILIK